MAGCGTQDRTQELQQQKLTLELMKSQTEQLAAMKKTQEERLAALTQKESELRALERSLWDQSEQLRRQEESLKRRDQEIAQAAATIESQKRLLDNRKEQIDAKAADIATRLLALEQREESERRKRETELQEQEERKRPEVLGRLKRRKPDLDALMDLVLELHMQQNPNDVRSQVSKELSRFFDNISWDLAKIEEEDAFAREATLRVRRGNFLVTVFGGALIQKAEASKECSTNGKKNTLDGACLIDGEERQRQEQAKRTSRRGSGARRLRTTRRRLGLIRKTLRPTTVGAMRTRKREWNKAIADFTEAIRLNPRLALAYGGRGFAYSQKDDWDKAIADCTEAIGLDPKLGLAYSSRGFAYLQKKEWDKAIADYTEAIGIDPKRAEDYASRGDAYSQKDDWDKAIAGYTEAIRLDPKNAWAYGKRGIAYRQKGEWDKAVADAKKVIELEPDDPQGYNTAAWLLATCPKDAVRNGAEAITFATKACELTEWKRPFLFDTLAAAYAEAGQFDKAVEWQQKALADPDAFPPQTFKDCKRRLELYKAGKPCREELQTQ